MTVKIEMTGEEYKTAGNAELLKIFKMFGGSYK